MSIRLTGLSEVTRNLEQLKKSLDAEIAGLKFDPFNRQDVERAIRQIKLKVDLKMAPYISSPGVQEIAVGLKDEVQKAILKMATAAREKSMS